MLERYILITCDGEISVVEFMHEELLRKCHELLNCTMIEPVYLRNYGDLLMIVDDAGKITDPPKRVNPVASMLYPGVVNGDVIVGDVLLGREGFVNGEPDICGLYDPALNYFIKFLTDLKESYYGY